MTHNLLTPAGWIGSKAANAALRAAAARAQHETRHQPPAARVRVVTWIEPAIAASIDGAAARGRVSSSGYIAAVLGRHVAILNDFADGMPAQNIAAKHGLSYEAVMRNIGMAVDQEAKELNK